MPNVRSMLVAAGIHALAGLAIAFSGLSFAAAPPAPAPVPAMAKPVEKPLAPPRQLSLSIKPWTGDFDGMVERRMIRVLVPYSRTLYFNDADASAG